ncbi:cytochrome C biogenesis protein [Massilia sp. Root351]|jgi:cytochrome c biogenesis protein CcdA|uniref:cytochrome c biogenesis CcdA family protein n=1 Tax=Massilia sp. Root351 TaxID=1736522 RepID=UPI000709F2BA|nr:cytochrome c biogenesis CcdA family protein [Massilia sp. Root351]KQV90613.1 cytochrome C biogenesis protein [Massilia sp. Root351]
MYNLLETPLALLAGVFTIASPCVLPVMPILLGSAAARPGAEAVAGVAGKTGRNTRPLFIVAGFILTFASFAMLLGAVSSAVHQAQEALRNAAIAMLAISGLLRLWPGPYDWLVARLQQALPGMGAAVGAGGAGDGHFGGFVLGMSLGAVWTPCAGPVLASILALVVRSQDLAWSALLITLYAIGAAIPMLGIIYGGQYATAKVRIVARHAARLQQVFGVLVIATAAAIYLQYDILIYAQVAAVFPTLKGL